MREDLIAEGSAISAIIYRAAQALSVLTQELGVAVVPSLDSVILEHLELLTVGSERLLLVLPGMVRCAAFACVSALSNGRSISISRR